MTYFWKDPVNLPKEGIEIIFQTPEEIMKSGLEDLERDGIKGQRGSTRWKQAIKAGSILDKAYGKDRN